MTCQRGPTSSGSRSGGRRCELRRDEEQRRRGPRVLQADPDALPDQAEAVPDRRQLSTHKTAAIYEWAATANTELIFTPTYASFLNRIECHFWGIGEFVINNADYPDWDTLAKAMADHIRYRNGPHRDKRLIAAERKLLIAAA